MMDINELKKLIPFYIAKTLDEKEKEKVEAGLKKFPELKSDLDFWIQAREATLIYVHINQTGHLSAEQIVNYVEEEYEGNLPALQKVEAHLNDCADCRNDVEIIRDTYSAISATSDIKPIKYTVKHLPWYRSIYTYTAVAIIIIGTILLLPKKETELENIGQQEIVYADITLPYKPLTRKASPINIPEIILDSAVTHIRLTVYIPHTIIDSLSYNAILVSPTQVETRIEDTYFPLSFDENIDTIQVSILRNNFHEIPGTYNLIIKENLPTSISELTPQSYIYTFRLKR